MPRFQPEFDRYKHHRDAADAIVMATGIKFRLAAPPSAPSLFPLYPRFINPHLLNYCMIDFNKMIDRFLFREQSPKQAGRYYPSEIGSCLRKVWYSYRFPQSVQPRLLKIFELGNILHDFVVKVMQSEKNSEVELLQFEVPIKLEVEDFVISGRIDDLLLLKANGKQLLVEVKSCKAVSFVREAQPHHAMQLQFYMHATGVHDGILLYIDRSTLESKVFTIPYNPVRASEIILRFKTLHTALAQSILPMAEAKFNPHMSWMCKFCEYKEKCDKNSKE
ncbi:MAG: PD-(D/E)XK nuclease family protein [Candidatus Aenigmatarchaeota archaeon]